MTINIIAYGREDTTFLTENEVKKMVMLGYQSIPKYVEIVHCNDSKPENKNIYIPSKKNMNKVMVYDGSKWKLRSSKVINELYVNGIDFIEGKFEELKDQGKIPQSAIRRLENVFNQMNNNDNEKNDQEYRKKINDEIKLVLYNNRPV